MARTGCGSHGSAPPAARIAGRQHAGPEIASHSVTDAGPAQCASIRLIASQAAACRRAAAASRSVNPSRNARADEPVRMPRSGGLAATDPVDHPVDSPARHHETPAHDGIVVWLRAGPGRSARRSVAGGGVDRICMPIAGCCRREFLELACGPGCLPASRGWAGRSVRVDPVLRITLTGWRWFASRVAICRDSVPALWRRYHRRGSRRGRRGVPGTGRCAGR